MHSIVYNLFKISNQFLYYNDVIMERHVLLEL